MERFFMDKIIILYIYYYITCLQIEDYVTKPSQDVPLMLVGGAGSGKSSIMARVADDMVLKAAQKQIPGYGVMNNRISLFFKH